MENTTPLQELIEWMNKEISFSESMVKEKAEELLKKAAKDLIDGWESLSINPLEELKSVFLKIKLAKEELPEAIKEAFPHLSEENMKRACEDMDFLENTLLNTAINSEKFGIMTEDPFKGKRLLMLGEVSDRKIMQVNLIESELKEMGFEVNTGYTIGSTLGWFLNTWNAECARVGEAAIKYVLTGAESRSIAWVKDSLEVVPGIPQLTKLEEVEMPETKKQIKTASTAKKFGI